MICKKCGAFCGEDGFCQRCGTMNELSGGKLRCNRCGAELTDGETCSVCGSSGSVMRAFNEVDTISHGAAIIKLFYADILLLLIGYFMHFAKFATISGKLIGLPYAKAGDHSWIGLYNSNGQMHLTIVYIFQLLIPTIIGIVWAVRTFLPVYVKNEMLPTTFRKHMLINAALALYCAATQYYYIEDFRTKLVGMPLNEAGVTIHFIPYLQIVVLGAAAALAVFLSFSLREKREKNI